MRNLRSQQQSIIDYEFALATGHRFPTLTTFFVILGTLDVASLVAWAVRL